VALDAPVLQKVTELAAAGDQAAEATDYGVALEKYQQAINLLPDPIYEFDAALWLLAAIGDVSYLKGDMPAARSAFMDAVKWFDDARGNPFIRLRLGQCLYDLGEFAAAEDWLAGAFLLEGPSLFEAEHPKYLQFARANLRPPPGGWPAGWQP
jgi:tetratricopeptide (TPR) repeat protein